MQTEVQSMQAVFPGVEGPALIDALNESPGEAVQIDAAGTHSLPVIDRGLWAEYFQRHLCQAIADTGDFFANKWGVPENTRELDEKVVPSFSGLKLFP